MGKLTQTTAEVQSILNQVGHKVDQVQEFGIYFANVDGLVSEYGQFFFLPTISLTGDKSHTFAMVADIDNAIKEAITMTLNTEV